MKNGKTEKNLNITNRFWFKSIFHCFYLLIFHMYFLNWNHISQKANIVLMILAFFEVGKKAMFFWFFENPSNGINVSLAWVLGIDENIIQINNDKNIELFGQHLIDITLKTSQCVRKSKKHYLVFEMAVLSLKGCLLFITLFYLYLIVSSREIELDELFGLT